MILKIKNIIFTVLVIIPVLLTSSPLVLLAQTGPVSPGSDRGPVNPDTGSPFRLNNPLGDATLIGFLQSLLGVIMIFAVPLIVFVIMLAGFKYVTAGGKSGEYEKANNMLLYAVIGAVLILGANALLVVIQGTIDAFR